MLPASAPPPEQLPLFDGAIDMSRLRREAAELRAQRRSANTRKAKTSDLTIWQDWCTAAGRQHLPASAETLMLFAAAQLHEGKMPSSIARRLSSIRTMHREAGEAPPDTQLAREVLTGAQRRTRYTSRAKLPLRVSDIRAALAILKQQGGPIAARDRAILVLGFCSGMRRSELSALDVSDVELTPAGIEISIRRSKTDQVQRGRKIGIQRAPGNDLCSARAVRDWLKVRGPKPGPLFTAFQGDRQTAQRAGVQAVNNAVKRAAASIGLNPARYGGHSLRSGMITAALESGAEPTAVMARTGQSIRTMLGYHRPVDAFTRDPLAKAIAV
jgi:integrase